MANYTATRKNVGIANVWCIHSQSHLIPIRFAICMNLLFRRAINIKFGHAKFCRKFSVRNTPPTDPHTNEILNPLHYKFLATPLPSATVVTASCDVCLNAPRVKVAYVPCGHTTFCQQCIDTLVATNSRCPVWRGVISSTIRFYN